MMLSIISKYRERLIDPSGRNHPRRRPILARLPGVVTRGVARVSTPYAATENRPLCRDISEHMGVYYPEVFVTNGGLLLFIRSNISWGYEDTYFQENWANAGELENLYRAAYHVIYPGQPVAAQVANWTNTLPQIDIIPRVIDLELSLGQSPARIAQDMWEASNLILAHDGIRPIIYSRYLLINDWLQTWTTTQLNQHFYWLAQYLNNRYIEHPGPPTIPNRVNAARVFMHQTADYKPPFPGEAPQTNTADWDRFTLGDEEDMHQWIYDMWGGDPPPPPPGDHEERITVLEDQVATLWQCSHTHSDIAVEPCQEGE